MYKITLLALFLLFPFLINAQSPIYWENDGDKTRKCESKYLGGFGAIALRATEFNNKTVAMAGIKSGWIIDGALAMGLEVHGVLPFSKYENYDTNTTILLLGGYGGIFIEPIFFSDRLIHFTLPVSAGAGWLGYFKSNKGLNETDNEKLLSEDFFGYIEPGISIEFYLIQNFRIAGGASRRFTTNLELMPTHSKAFDHISYFLTFKLGTF